MSKKAKKKKGRGWLLGLSLLLFCMALSLFLYTLFSLLGYQREAEASDALNQKLLEQGTAEKTQAAEVSTPEPAAAETPAQSQEPVGGAAEVPDATPFHEEVQEAEEEGAKVPLSVDFAALQEDCPDIIGWLYCPDTPINCPVVQGEDNQRYLSRLADGTKNNNGCLFADYRSAGDFTDWNTVIYGHNMKSKAMFGSLDGYREQAYYQAHPQLYLLTPNKNYKLTVLYGFETSVFSAVYTFPSDKAGRDEALKLGAESSFFTTEEQAGEEERIVTLSTCLNDREDYRFVLLCALREL